MRGGQVWPGFVDGHTHLDKGHIWPRAANPDGTFYGALTTVFADREANWSAEDIRARFAFGLACAYAHGTVAIAYASRHLFPACADHLAGFRRDARRLGRPDRTAGLLHLGDGPADGRGGR